MLLTQPPIPSILAARMKPYIGNPEAETDKFESREGDWDCTLGDLVDRMVRFSGEDKAAAARRLWTVMYFDAVELGHLAVGNVILRYVDGELVVAGRVFREEVANPVALFC
jgi:hypothetical protein